MKSIEQVVVDECRVPGTGVVGGVRVFSIALDIRSNCSSAVAFVVGGHVSYLVLVVQQQ